MRELPAQIAEFATYLRGLVTRLDQDGGWCHVFWQRDPEGMRACMEGRDVPPWDVVESLLQDLAALRGTWAVEQEAGQARALHAAALAAYDFLRGGREALGDRLDQIREQQRYAAERQAELSKSLHEATSPEEAEALRLDLAWVRDDHERASARCAELRARMADLDRQRSAAEATSQGTSGPQRGPSAQEDPEVGHRPAKQQSQEARQPYRTAADQMLQTWTADPADSLSPYRAADSAEGTRGKAQVQGRGVDEEARRAIAEAVEKLQRLRAEGRGGEAHGVLVEAASWPPACFPLLAVELHNAGLGADWATLLWETAALELGRLIAVADALAAVGRTADSSQILRQGVARPAREIGDAVVRLIDQDRQRNARALLEAYVSVRTPEEAALSAQSDPRRVVPLLLDAARGVSEQRHRDVVHALRVAGLPTQVSNTGWLDMSTPPVFPF